VVIGLRLKMSNLDRDLALKQLYDAFALVEKPAPLTSYQGSYCDEEVNFFNELNWEEATYSDVVDGLEGLIIYPEITKLWLLPRLFKMVLLRRSGTTDGAIDNLSSTLREWPTEASVEVLLSNGQKKAIVAAWSYLDRYLYYPSGNDDAQKLARRWSIEL
jgi:hypothetical protein